MAEKNVKGYVKAVVGQITTDEWLDKYVNAQTLKGEVRVQTSWGHIKRIPGYQACLIFTPKTARGQNGVMLTDFLGIGDIREINIRMSDESGYRQDIAWYPLGTPINETTCHEEACTMMIGQQWRTYKSIQREKKWCLLGTFNVLQFFFYNSSQAFVSGQKKADALKYMGYMKSIFDSVLPKLLERDETGELKQIVFGEANSLESHDVLHTALSLSTVDSYMPNEARSINRKQIFESLMKKSLERMLRYQNERDCVFDRNVDFSVYTAHYTLFVFVPLCMEFLTGKFGSASDALETYLDQIKSMRDEMKMNALKKGVQQFRLVLSMSRISAIVDEDAGAKIFIRVLGGSDVPLPEALKNARKRDAKAVGKGLAVPEQQKKVAAEENKNGASEAHKRPRQDGSATEDGPDMQFEEPFRIYSRSVNTVPALKSTFGAVYGNIVLPEEGFYQINLQATLNGCFYGKDTYRNQSSLISQFRVGFAVQDQQEYYHCRDEDTFSVSGVWYQSDKGRYNQLQPLKFMNSQGIDFQVIFKNGNVFVSQNNQLTIKLSPSANNKFNQGKSLRLSLQGANCIATIQRSDALEDDLKRLEKIDTKYDTSCSICLDKAVKPHQLKCGHEFCTDCIDGWLHNHRECPICRAQV